MTIDKPSISTNRQMAAPVIAFIKKIRPLSMEPKEFSMDRCSVKMDAAASA